MAPTTKGAKVWEEGDDWGPFTAEQIEVSKHDKDSVSMVRYPLPFEALRTDDRFASYWFAKMSQEADLIIPSSRLDILKRLLINSTKFRYLTIETIRAKVSGNRFIIFVQYPIQQSNVPETTTDTANVILDHKFPGIYIENPTELIKLRKKRVAGYCSLENDTEFHGSYDQEEIKTFCLAYKSLICDNYSNDKTVKDEKEKKAWNPAGTFKSIF